ncbi:MAG: RidA family protein [Candidatus Fibromonas sp.]|jgi:enamine deaminase RidA (YjgF/YER057c/UK114 family)|nr:RidA family protein [Candidatus Fibromonas sp.]
MLTLKALLNRFQFLSLSLPEVLKPLAAYIPAKRSGDLIFVSGQLPIANGNLLAEGTVPDIVSVEKAKECAKQCLLNGIAAAFSLLQEKEGLEPLQIQGFVQSKSNFYSQPAVIDGASELLLEIFGESGKHSRAAVGVAALPKNVPVEIAFVFKVER